MMKFQETKSVNHAALTEEMRQWWKANKIFEKATSGRTDAPKWNFYEGPPSANGTPGIHHVMARTVKDLFCRFKTMQGYRVDRKGGWDTHGLPVEIAVEKQLGITKDDIGVKISVEDYNAHCKKAVMEYTDLWNEVTEKMGYWVDLENPYVTYHSTYIESLWSILKRLFDRDLLYKGFTIQPYSPAAGTGLSSHELNQPGCYRMVKDTSMVAQFEVIREAGSEKLFSGDEKVYFLAWTTTPWTLPANSALAVGDNIEYVKIKTFNPYTFLPVSVILAKDLTGKYFSEAGGQLTLIDYKPGDKIIPWKLEGSFKGKELIGIRYHQLMPYVIPDEPAFRVISGDFVSTEDGTGIVHISPTFGADDFRVAQKAGIPAILVKDKEGKLVPIVNKQGAFVSEIKDFAGMYVKNYTGEDESAPGYKSTDVLISIKLKEENKAFKVEKYEHSYPHCWRTDKPVLYYPMESWFIKTTALKDRMVELNQTINWKPAGTGTGRFGNWLENLVDWNLSRSRYWGTPLPIWSDEKETEWLCIGSMGELKEGLEKALLSGALSDEQKHWNKDLLDKMAEGEVDLHRPWVDRIVLLGSKGQVMYRQTDLVDVWFDSGAMPYAQLHWPFENEGALKTDFPADFIAEGVDQTRGWFYTLHAIGVLGFDSVAFKNVVANGLVLDKDGNKMSKRLGNAVDPFVTIDKYGADPVRWYMVGNAAPWENLKFNLAGVEEVQRKFFGTLSNTYSFFALYANLDGYTQIKNEKPIPLGDRTESDRWILSRLNSLITTCTSALEDFEPTPAVRAISDFVNDELSNWYVRLNRKRFWKGELGDDKKAAYQTLFTCLEQVALLMAPFAPFYAEKLYRDLHLVSGTESDVSVHLAPWPKFDIALFNPELEARMSLAQKATSLVHSIRKQHQLKVRQPLRRMLIPVLNPELKNRMESVADLILSEVNIKEINFIEDTHGLVTKKVKPDFKKLGKALGPKLKPLGDALAQLEQDAIFRLEKDGKLEMSLIGEPFTLNLEDVEISSQDMPGWIVASEGELTVALDLELTDELRMEGYARELVNRLQNLRKDSGFDVVEKINILYQRPDDELVLGALTSFKDYVAGEVQALSIQEAQDLSEAVTLDLDGAEISLEIRRNS